MTELLEEEKNMIIEEISTSLKKIIAADMDEKGVQDVLSLEKQWVLAGSVLLNAIAEVAFREYLIERMGKINELETGEELR